MPTVHQRNGTSCDGVCQEISNYFFRVCVSSLVSSAVGAGGREPAAVVLCCHRAGSRYQTGSVHGPLVSTVLLSSWL